MAKPKHERVSPKAEPTPTLAPEPASVEPLPSDLKSAFAALKQANRMPERTPVEAMAKRERVARLGRHVKALQQTGQPVNHLDIHAFVDDRKRHQRNVAQRNAQARLALLNRANQTSE